MQNEIDKRFDELLTDIESDYKLRNADTTVSDPKFLLWMYSAEELIETGFCKRNVDKVMEGIGDEVVSEYFDNTISNLTAQSIGGVSLIDSAGCTTIGQFIAQIKRAAVTSFLNVVLSKFIEKLKTTGESGLADGTIN